MAFSRFRLFALSPLGAAATSTAIVVTACADPTPSAQVTPNDHFFCFEGDTDSSQEEVPLPFGDTGIADTGSVDETGDMLDEVDNGTHSRAIAFAPSGFEGFVSTRIQRLDQNTSIFDGDIAISNNQVRRIYARSSGASGTRSLQTESGFRSTVACEFIDRRDDRLNQAQLAAFTYCFGDFQDATLEEIIRDAIATSTWKYEVSTDVNFVHLAELDGPNCDTDSDVIFLVRQGADPDDCGGTGCPLARAFFPSSLDGGTVREIIFFPEVATTTTFSIDGIVQHELGHTLGMWHEQARYVQDDDVIPFEDQIKCASRTRSNARFHRAPPSTGGGLLLQIQTPSWVIPTAAERRVQRSNYPTSTGWGFAICRSFNDDVTDDIFWYRPGQTTLSLWYGTSAPDDIIFTDMDFCWDTSQSPDCGDPMPADWKPIPVQIENRASVLMYGPGTLLDRFYQMPPDPGDPTRFTVAIGLQTAVPRVGDLVDEVGTEDVLFEIPGPGNSDWGLAGGTSQFDVYDSAEGTNVFFDAAIGVFVSRAGSLGDQILWYSEDNSSWTVNFRTNAGVQEELFDPEPCGIDDSSPLNALVGNFDADPNDEILWYSNSTESAILWTDLDNCAVDQYSFAIEGTAKPHVGDFDGDGRIDVIWNRAGQDDEIWLFVNPDSPIIISTTVPDDTIPIVGDFNGDNCSDVLWYRSHVATSPIWRSLCDGTFEMDMINTPQNAAPVGYAYGHGRAYR